MLAIKIYNFKTRGGHTNKNSSMILENKEKIYKNPWNPQQKKTPRLPFEEWRAKLQRENKWLPSKTYYALQAKKKVKDNKFFVPELSYDDYNYPEYTEDYEQQKDYLWTPLDDLHAKQEEKNKRWRPSDDLIFEKPWRPKKEKRLRLPYDEWKANLQKQNLWLSPKDWQAKLEREKKWLSKEEYIKKKTAEKLLIKKLRFGRYRRRRRWYRNKSLRKHEEKKEKEFAESISHITKIGVEIFYNKYHSSLEEEPYRIFYYRGKYFYEWFQTFDTDVYLSKKEDLFGIPLFDKTGVFIIQKGIEFRKKVKTIFIVKTFKKKQQFFLCNTNEFYSENKVDYGKAVFDEDNKLMDTAGTAAEIAYRKKWGPLHRWLYNHAIWERELAVRMVVFRTNMYIWRLRYAYWRKVLFRFVKIRYWRNRKATWLNRKEFYFFVWKSYRVKRNHFFKLLYPRTLEFCGEQKKLAKADIKTKPLSLIAPEFFFHYPSKKLRKKLEKRKRPLSNVHYYDTFLNAETSIMSVCLTFPIIYLPYTESNVYFLIKNQTFAPFVKKDSLFDNFDEINLLEIYDDYDRAFDTFLKISDRKRIKKNYIIYKHINPYYEMFFMRYDKDYLRIRERSYLILEEQKILRSMEKRDIRKKLRKAFRIRKKKRVKSKITKLFNTIKMLKNRYQYLFKLKDHFRQTPIKLKFTKTTNILLERLLLDFFWVYFIEQCRLFHQVNLSKYRPVNGYPRIFRRVRKHPTIFFLYLQLFYCGEPPEYVLPEYAWQYALEDFFDDQEKKEKTKLRKRVFGYMLRRSLSLRNKDLLVYLRVNLPRLYEKLSINALYVLRHVRVKELYELMKISKKGI